MVKQRAMASDSIAKGSKSSARKTKPKSTKKVSCLKIGKIVKLKREIVSASVKSKKISLKTTVQDKKQVKLQNRTRNITTGKRCLISKLNKNKVDTAKITRKALSSKKIIKQLTGQEVTTSTSSRKYLQPKILKSKRSITKLKLPKLAKISSSANTTVAEQIQQLESSLPESLQKVITKKRNNSKPNSIKLKATIDKTEVLNNNGEWSTFEELIKDNTEINNTDNINETIRMSSCAKTTSMQCKVKKNYFVNSALEVQNNVQEDNIGLDISEKDERPNPKTCSAADTKLQKVNKNIQQVTKMVSNVKEKGDKQNKTKVEVPAKAAMGRSNNFPLENDEGTSEVRIKDCIDKSITNSGVKKPISKSNQRENGIKKRKPVSKRKLKGKFIVKIKKTKLPTGILGQLGKKASDASMDDCSSCLSSKEASDAETNVASSSYLDNKHLNKYKHSGNAYKKNRGSESSQIEDEVSKQNGEDTQEEEDNEEAVQAVKKKRKVHHRSKQLIKSTAEEIGMEKLSTIDQSIDYVIKKYSKLSEKSCKKEKRKIIYEPLVITKNMRIIEDPQDAKITKNRFSEIEEGMEKTYLSTIDQTIDDVIKKYSKLSEKSCKKEKSKMIYEPIVITKNMRIIEDTQDTKITKNRFSEIETITNIKKKYRENITKRKRKKNCTKTPVVFLEDVLLNKYFIEKYNLNKDVRKPIKDCESPSKTLSYSNPDSSLNCFASSNPVSPLLKDSTTPPNINPSKLSTALTTASTGEFSRKINNNYGGVSNIRITCNVGENKAIVNCVPISNQNMPVNKICDNANAPLHHVPVSDDSQDDKFQDDESQDDDSQDETLEGSYFNWNWTEIYDFPVDDAIKIDSYDGIFENADFSFKRGDIIKEGGDIAAVPINKPLVPIITVTVDNNYATKKVASCNTNTCTTVTLMSNTTEGLRDEGNSFQEDAFYDSDGSSVQPPADSKMSLQSSISNEFGQTLITKNSNTATAALNDAIIPALCDSVRVSPTPTATQNAGTKLSINSGQTYDTRESVFSRLDPPKNLQFKVPFLPPAKRPPAHLKSNSPPLKSKHVVSCSLAPSAPSIQGETSSVYENDDALSIFASSIGSAANLEEEFSVDDVLEDHANSIFAKGVEESAQNTCPQSIEIPTPVEVTEVDPSSAKSLILPNSPNVQNDITKWLAKCQSETNQLQVKVPSTPVIFRRLCYFHFGNKRCLVKNCKKLHQAQAVGNEIMNLPRDKLIEAYAYAKNKCKLYTETFNYFVCAFEKLKCTNILMQFVEDILRIEIYNKTPLIEKIVTSLCNIGVPYIDVIQEILMFVDGGKNVCLSDILLDIVCICHKQHLYNNWCIVQHLIKHRTEPIDRGLVEEIMTVCSQHSNVKLAVCIVQEFIVSRMVDLKAINIHTLNNFLSTLEYNKLEEEQILRAQMESNGILIIPPLRHSGIQNLVSAENANGRNIPNKMPMASNKSNLLNATKIKSSPLNDDTGFMPHKATAVQKQSSFSNTSRESNSIPRSNNRSELDFHDNFENDASFSKNSKHQCDGSNRNANTKYVTNTESHNDRETDNYNSRSINTPSPVFSENSNVPVSLPSSIGSDEDIDSNFGANDFELNIPHCNSLSQDVVPSRSATSAGGSSKSKHTVNLDTRNINNLESHNNEFEFNFNEDGNLSPSTSMNCIPVHTLEDKELISNSDLLLLKKISERGNNLEFFKMLSKFKDTESSRAFILNTLVYYKAKTTQDIYEMFFPIITGMAYLDPTLKNDNSLMSMLHVLVVNLLGLLENHQAYDKASEILLQFHGNYEKLCNSTWFMGPHRYNYSEIGKYIYFCKILVKGHHLKQAWEILTFPELKLLYGINKWVLKHCDCFDNKLRNYVLSDLINTALDIDIQFAKDVLLCLIHDNNIITEIDVWKPFNQLLLRMVDDIKYVKDLTSMIENIIEGWYNYLFPVVMRGLLVRLALEIPETDALELFDKCCRRKCYPYIRGDEHVLYFNTNMVEVEIYMTLHVYIYKKVRNHFPLHRIILRMGLPDPAHQRPHILSNSHCSPHDLKLKVANVLASGLPFTVCVDYSNIEDQCLFIQADQLRLIFNYYRKLKENK